MRTRMPEDRVGQEEAQARETREGERGERGEAERVVEDRKTMW